MLSQHSSLYLTKRSVTHGDKCGEQATGACSDLCPVSLGPLLRLLAPEYRSRDVGQIPWPVWNLLVIWNLVLMLRHTGYR